MSHSEQELAALNLMLSAQQKGDLDLARVYWNRLVALHQSRPAEQVRAMENAQGLN